MLRTGAMALAAAGASTAAHAATYSDAIGDVAVTGAPFPHIDIRDVEVSNTASALIFKINVVGDPIADNWGKYMVGIDSAAGGSSTGNSWGRPINMADMDHWLGGWADGGSGGMLDVYAGAWSGASATYGPNPANLSVMVDPASYTFSVDLAALGLVPGSTIRFDVFTSGGSGDDGAVDALSSATPSVTAWQDPFTTVQPLTYTVVVPEVSTTALGFLGVCAAGLRRRR